ncbi:MAG: hypothetical protein DHS20C05_10300 [Hyphococcus sp.]|nr:MAG: hypothetical protein DHS20C05_10300 [Marinicaulis sp.]
MNDDRTPMADQDHLREMIEVISGELELRPLLTTIVQKACELLDADRGSIGLVDPSGRFVRIEAVYKMPPEELGSTAASGEGLAGKVFRDRAPVLIERYGDLTSPQLAGMDEDSVVGMPIIWRGDIMGTFGIGADAPKRFGDNDLNMLEVFARHAAIAINNARSYEKEQKYASLRERQRLAHDLHDSVSQLIFSLSLVAQSIGPGFEKSTEEGETRIARLRDIASLAQNEMKALLVELKGPSEDDDGTMAAFARRNGLAAAVKRHCDLATPDHAKVTIDIGNNESIATEWNEALLRITQEALANAFRHGGAQKVSVSLHRQGKDYVYRIIDDGCGMAADPSEPRASSNIGVDSMRARANAAGGSMKIENSKSGGVCVEVRFPLP